MVTFERPCCTEPIVVDHPLTGRLRCEECSIEWEVADPDPATPALVALAA